MGPHATFHYIHELLFRGHRRRDYRLWGAFPTRLSNPHYKEKRRLKAQIRLTPQFHHIVDMRNHVKPLRTASGSSSENGKTGSRWRNTPLVRLYPHSWSQRRNTQVKDDTPRHRALVVASLSAV